MWCVPGSPYHSAEGALAAIRFAREKRRVFLGTCGGFQHALIEFARNVLGVSQAEHAETAPTAPDLVVTDFRMPHLSGVDLIRRLRERGLRCPALLVTGYADNEDIAAAEREHLVFDVVAKPWRVQALRASVRAALDGVARVPSSGVHDARR